MAGDWLKWEKRLYNKPEILATARGLGVDVATACLCWFRLWEWADDVTTTGHVSGVQERDIDAITQQPGFSRVAVDVGWLVLNPDGVTIPNYRRHNGEPAKQRALAAERKRVQRRRETPSR